VRIVARGVGTGLSALLRGLKQHVARRKQAPLRLPIGNLAAVVTVTDDGGNSGRLRRDSRILPPVEFGRGRLERLGLAWVSGKLLEEDGVVRHNSCWLARLLPRRFVEARPGA
jgi:2-phospho-L-lactate transferase CofD